MPRHRKPNSAKIIQGTFRRDRANENEPDPLPVDGIPKPPKNLPKAAKDEWENVIGWLVTNKIVGAEGLGVVETYCRLHAVMKDSANLMMVPASYIAQYKSLATALCLTPDGRAKFKAPKPKQQANNPFEAFK